jgi:hypothetical protein
MLDGRHIGIHWDPTLDDGQSSQREPLAMTITRFKAEIKVRLPAGFTWNCQVGLPGGVAKKVRDSAHLHALQVGERGGRSIAATSDWAP